MVKKEKRQYSLQEMSISIAKCMQIESYASISEKLWLNVLLKLKEISNNI
jgi:hypothetical protein